MSYIGNTNTTQGFTPAIDYFSGNASTTAFTLSRPVASVAQVQAVVNNVAQNPSDAFTVSGNTITFTSAPSSGTNNIYVYYTSPITQVIAPSQGTVGTTQLQNGLTVNFADGTAAAPSITNDGDTNTGIFFPAADTIAFAEGGAEAMRIDSSGNVGIGTTTPDSRLTISKNSASPAAITGTSYLNIVGANSESPKLNFDAYANLNTIIFRRANGTQASPSALVSGDQMGNFAVFGYGATSYTTTNRGFISFNADENWTDSAQGSRIAFATTTAGTASAATERMRIDSSGNLLVGTTSTTPNPGVALFPNGAISQGNSAGSSGYEFLSFRRSATQIGSVTQNGTTAVAFNTSSDYRLKEAIAPMTGALAKVVALKPCTYKWKIDGSDGQGFIAHELAEVVPDCVTGVKDAVETYTDEDGNEQTRPKYQGIDTSFLVATLTAAIQEQQSLITALTARITALENT
jgi:hypothetical protein